MRLSALYEMTARYPGIENFSVYLASPDPTRGDSVDVQLMQIGWVETNDEEQVCLFPASAGASPDAELDYSIMGILLARLPFDPAAEDPVLVVELPLFRDESGGPRYGFSEMRAIHVGQEAEEVWLLVRPKEEFLVDSLPS